MGRSILTNQAAPQRADRQRAPSNSRAQPRSRRNGSLQRSIGNCALNNLLRSRVIQPKLTVSKPDDEYEREADRVADHVMRMPAQAVPQISRKCSSCANERKSGEEVVQRKFDMSTAADVSSSLDVLQTGGTPLDEPVRQSMESRFGRDFSGVRIHTGARAARSATSLQALAYTTGRNIVFGAGQYRPHTPEGERLLAHELTHVVQQQGATPWSPGTDTLPGGGQSIRLLPPLDSGGDVFEREASVMRKRNESFRQLQSASLQRYTLPRPLPICGALVTDVDVLPARPRPLTECGLPPTVMVTRINIVGRARHAGSTGRGRIIFNLHIGYYTDPATGRFCAVASDSTRCLTPGGCIHLGCLPTLREIIDAILDFLKFLGIVILAIILYLLLRGIRLPTLEPVPSPVMAGGPGEQEGNMEA
jgi:hypothetical protein